MLALSSHVCRPRRKHVHRILHLRKLGDVFGDPGKNSVDIVDERLISLVTVPKNWQQRRLPSAERRELRG